MKRENEIWNNKNKEEKNGKSDDNVEIFVYIERCLMQVNQKLYFCFFVSKIVFEQKLVCISSVHGDTKNYNFNIHDCDQCKRNIRWYTLCTL